MAQAESSQRATFLAQLHPVAARFNLKPHLSDVTLANVLAGDTCSPISLLDFEKYLSFTEFTVENLQFIVWFQDYRQRYINAFGNSTDLSEDGFVFNSPSRARTEERAEASIANLQKVQTGERHSLGLPATPTTSNDPLSPTSLSPMLPVQDTQFSLLPSGASKSNDSDLANFRAECSRAVATFLTPNSKKELTLDSVIRETVIRNLALLDCHPDAFLPVYEEMYSSLETSSLSRFLSATSANINLPKQIYWYFVGVFNMVLGILIVLLLIMLLPIPPQGNRAYRVFPAFIFALGAAQIYSAWRGYCSQVWMRGATQLRVWEMQEVDEEARAFVDGILDQHRFPAQDPSSSLADRRGPPPTTDVAMIAPFTVGPSESIEPLSIDDAIPPNLRGTPSAGASHEFNRPPIFGPEILVLDPRIKAVHRQLMIAVCQCGVIFLLVM
ncbi:hypothetical protein H0H92_005305 [Tricholoma furcatifolium]|nr:hypothetical protein H0H92_005305 [Tricholoma furcatifolium]